MRRIYYCSLPSRVVQFIIPMLWMVAQPTSITEDGLLNTKTWFLGHGAELNVLSQMVTAKEKWQVTRAGS